MQFSISKNLNIWKQVARVPSGFTWIHFILKLVPDNGKPCVSLQVTGELLDDLTSWDALRAALPVGTVSGAPKVKFSTL